MSSSKKNGFSLLYLHTDVSFLWHQGIPAAWGGEAPDGLQVMWKPDDHQAQNEDNGGDDDNNGDDRDDDESDFDFDFDQESEEDSNALLMVC